MNLKKFRIKHLSLVLFFLLSFVAGGINGFLGTGGGIIFIFMLSMLTDNDTKDNYATSLCAILIISSFGVIPYARRSLVDFAMIGQVALPAALGGIVGALLVDKMKVKYLNLIFALLIIYSGFCLIFR
jgi:uncharacterized membrane protein YfcA